MQPESTSALDVHTWVRPFVYIFAAMLGALACFVLALGMYGKWLDERAAREWAVSDGICNIAVIPVQGDIVPYDGFTFYEGSSSIVTSGDWVARYVRDASYDGAIWGVLLQIDSYGGLAAPSHQMANALRNSSLPTVAYIREMGTSGAYLAATGADTIVASPFASIGSIGITYSYVENWGQNEQEGLNFVELSSGKFKDTGNPNKPLTEEERELYARDIEIFKGTFVDLVAANRGLDVEDVETLADGSSMPASLALEAGLIDSIGDEDTVREWFADELGVTPEDIILCN